MSNKENKLVQSYMRMLLIVPLFCFGLVSCEDFFETNIEIEPPEVVKKLVVNAFIKSSQEELEVFTGKNVGLDEILSNDNVYINTEFKIENVENDKILTVPNLGFYDFDYLTFNHYLDNIDTNFFGSNSTYSFRATDPSSEYTEVSYTGTFPSKTEIKEAVFEFDGGIREDGDEASSITVTFNDPPDEKNFYEVAIMESAYGSTYASTIDLSASKGFEDDFLLLSDESFNGEEKTIEIKVYRYSDESQARYNLQWRDITEDYYKYSKTLKAHTNTGDNPFTSIAPIYTNVENGAGIISLYQEQEIRLY